MKRKRSFIQVLSVGLALVLGGALSPLHAQNKPAAARAATGPSGLPIPRFVSLKSDRVNVRRGPSKSHQVAWVFSRKGLPVEIVAEFDNWRRVRDSEGEEGWVFQALLDGERTAIIAPWRAKEKIRLYKQASTGSPAVALVEAGVVGRIGKCSGTWCTFSTSGFSGWIEQDNLWGVYPGEKIDR